MSARDTAIARANERQAFIDTLTNQKNEQLRSTMNGGLASNTGTSKGVVPLKDVNPNSLENIRERKAIDEQNSTVQDAWASGGWKTKNDFVPIILLVIIGFYLIK